MRPKQTDCQVGALNKGMVSPTTKSQLENVKTHGRSLISPLIEEYLSNHSGIKVFIVRKQFNRMVLEQTFSSESQAILVADKSYKVGSWQHVLVFSIERNEIVVELGQSPNIAKDLVYAQAVK